jgi:hypothetical protein
MKGRPVEQLVYEYMFPKPRPSDPQNFTVFLQRHLVLEVRQEVHSFYGHLETPEAKYPGLDYTHRTHRIRLSRWPWHRRLFRAFDGLRLTPNEIAGLTKWEGTKWAKERYEKEQGITILDTTEVDMYPRSSMDREASEQQGSVEPGEGLDDTMAEDSDEELASVGFDLNQRLRERVAMRNVSGDMSMVIDEEWERWLKDAIETGQLPEIASRIYGETQTTPREPPSMDAASVREMMTAAREGRWEDVPEYYHAMFRGVFHDEVRGDRRVTPLVSRPVPMWQRTTRTPTPATANGGSSESMASRARLLQPQRRRHWSNLRLPSGDSGSPDAGWLLPGA